MKRSASFEVRLAPAQAFEHRVEQRKTQDGAAVDVGVFEGYGCIFGIQDSYGTTFERGCFTTGGLDERAYPLLWMHEPWSPGGVFTAKEDDTGLWIAGTYDPTGLGQDMRARAVSGSAPELSVGFIWRNSNPDDENLITDARLVETSQITLRMAAVPGAHIAAARANWQQVPGATEPNLAHVEADTRAAARIAAARLGLLGVQA